MQSICRTCLREISDNFLSLTDDEESLQVKTELSFCIPEVDVNLVIDPVMCFTCVNVLHAAYKFKKQCLQTEEHISSYMQKMNSNVNCISSPQEIGKINASSLQSCITTASNTSVKVKSGCMTRDIIDDLNSLLDEALQNAPKRCEIFGDKNKNDSIIELERSLLNEDSGSTPRYGELETDIYDECIIQPNEIAENNNQRIAVVQKNMALRECFVKCTKLPDNLNYSNINVKSLEKILLRGSPLQSKEKPDFNNQSCGDDERLFRCGQCGYKNSDIYIVKRHEKKIHGVEKPFLCSMCDYRSAYFYVLKRHMKVHRSKKPFVCSICSSVFKNKSMLETHMSQHSDIKPFACKMCNKKYSRPAHLKEHMFIHTGDMPFSCNKCSFATTRKRRLQEHMQNHVATTRKHRLQEHMQNHIAYKPFSCNLCSFATSRKPYLKLHQKVHTDEKPFACNICSFRTKSKSYLKIHLCFHSGKMPWACKMCSFKTAIRAHLKRHERIHCRA